MCLAILSSNSFTINFMGEYINLTIGNDGQLIAREIYDIFFTARPFSKNSWDDTRLIAISPHDLIKNFSINVKAIDAPGAGGQEDLIYKYGHGYGVNWDETKRIFSISVFSGRESLTPIPENYNGEVLLPEVKIPPTIKNNDFCLELMTKSGTVLEIEMGKLEIGQMYAIRLEVVPNSLLGFSGANKFKSIFFQVFGIPINNYSADLVIYSPRTCYMDFLDHLKTTREYDKSYTQAAAIIQSVVKDNRLNLITIERHRLAVVTPPDVKIVQHATTGCVWHGDCYTINSKDKRNACEWASGAKTYWPDDIEFLARAIWDHMSKWAVMEPKTKEDVTASLNGYHPNCSTVIDFLTGQYVLIKEGKTYRANNVGNEQLEEIFALIPTEIKDFRWMGYEIPYSIKYEFSSKSEKRILIWLQYKNIITFWIAVLSLIIGIISLYLSVFVN